MDNSWRVTLWFLFGCLPLAGLLKSMSLFQASESLHKRWRFFFATPLMSIESCKRLRPVTTSAIRSLLNQLVLKGLLSIAAYRFYWVLTNRVNPSPIILAYLSVPFVYLLSEVFSTIAQLLSMTSGHLIPAYHDCPLYSRSLSEFWGRRWNIWYIDWFKQVVFRPMKSRPVLATFMTFTVSGLIHEAVISLSLVFITGTCVLGAMTSYFLIQGVGVVIDKAAWNNRTTLSRRIFLWGVIILPIPLFMNEASLRMFRLWPI